MRRIRHRLCHFALAKWQMHSPFAIRFSVKIRKAPHSLMANDRQRLGFADFNAEAKWQMANLV
jgi:hypothetical protein